MSKASRASVNLLAAISVLTGVREPVTKQLGAEEKRETLGAARRHCSQILTASRSPIAPRFMQEYPVYCWALGP